MGLSSISFFVYFVVRRSGVWNHELGKLEIAANDRKLLKVTKFPLPVVVDRLGDLGLGVH